MNLHPSYFAGAKSFSVLQLDVLIGQLSSPSHPDPQPFALSPAALRSEISKARGISVAEALGHAKHIEGLSDHQKHVLVTAQFGEINDLRVGADAGPTWMEFLERCVHNAREMRDHEVSWARTNHLDAHGPSAVEVIEKSMLMRMESFENAADITRASLSMGS